jgi:hypothetical protein
LLACPSFSFASASLQVADKMSFDFRKWYDNAHDLVLEIRRAKHWRHRCHNYGNSISATDDPTPEQVKQRFRDANARADAEVDAIFRDMELIKQSRDKLREGIESLWPLLEVGYFDLRDFNPEGLPGGRCVWVAIDNLAERVQRWGGEIAYARQIGRNFNLKELEELQEREAWLEPTVDAIRARLALEKSWLLKHHHPPLVIPEANTETPPPPPKNKGGRPSKTTPERAEQVAKWWQEFLDAPEPKGYKRPSYCRRQKGTDDFLAWGEFKRIPNFPTTKAEVDDCKRRNRNLKQLKVAKTKRPKRR